MRVPAPDPASTKGTLHWYRSNRMEVLADSLATVLASAGGDPLDPELVVVPGRGVSQWLSQVLSRRLGIWANVTTLYPKNFARWAAQVALGESEAKLGVDPDALFWAVYAELQGHLHDPAFSQIARYLDGDTRGVRYAELCQRVSEVFDRYVLYRPDQIERWETQGVVDPRAVPAAAQLGLFRVSEDTRELWQARLWRSVVARLGSGHSAGLETLVIRGLQRKTNPRLPRRLCAVGVVNLPPRYLRIVVALSKRLPVHFFQLVPGPDALPSAPSAPRAGARLAPSAPGLRESLGSTGQEFAELLLTEATTQRANLQTTDRFEPPAGQGPLHWLQRDLLGAVQAAPPGPERTTISVHACHGRLREVEVLHDQLTAWLSSNTGIAPEDVVVLTPDINRYAPYIEAVFGRHSAPGARAGHRIPFSIADRSARSSAELFEVLARVTELGRGRTSASSVLDLLSLSLVSRRFGLAESDLEAVHDWVSSAAIRWGIDAEHKAEHHHPRDELNTWRFGMSRLLLGHLVPDTEEGALFDYRPEGQCEGEAAHRLGRFSTFVDVLFTELETLSTPRTLPEWRGALVSCFDRLCADDSDSAWQHQALKTVLRELCGQAEASGFTGVIPLGALTPIVLGAAAQQSYGQGFLSTGVTFCSMVPLRSIPFKVVALLGMSDRDFPRREVRTDFDLMAAAQPRKGDRSRRGEDRQLLLEAILSAREHLVFIYDGQSIRDNSKLPPSVLLSEVLDHLRDSDCGGSVQIVEHPLQPFSPRYFGTDDSNLFSFEERYFRGAASVRERLRETARFWDKPLDTPESVEPIELGQFLRFFAHPQKSLGALRLGLKLADTSEELLDREPHDVPPLTLHRLGDDLLRLLLGGMSEERAWEQLYRTGFLPRALPAELWRQQLLSEVRPLKLHVERLRQEPPLPPLDVVLPLGKTLALSGRLTERYESGLLRFQYSRVRARHLVRLWIEHQVQLAAGPGTASGRPMPGARLLGREEDRTPYSFEFAPTEAPRLVLEKLGQYYAQGQAAPLPFFPEVSHAWVLALRSRDPSQAWDRADRVWQDALKIDPHLRLCFGRQRLREALGVDRDAFEQIAQDIFHPLLQALRSEALPS